MQVADVMTKDVATIGPDEPILAAARYMLDRSVGSLIVSVDGRLRGIITDRDLLCCISNAHNPNQCKVSMHISHPVVTERPDENLLVAAEVMMRRGIKRLPITEDGRVVGIVSFSDISRVAHELTKTLWSTGAAVATLVRALALYKGRQKEITLPKERTK